MIINTTNYNTIPLVLSSSIRTKSSYYNLPKYYLVRFMMAAKGPKLPKNNLEKGKTDNSTQNPTNSPISTDMIKAAESCNFPTTDHTKKDLPSFHDKIPSQKSSDSEAAQKVHNANYHANKSINDAYDRQGLPEKPSQEPAYTPHATTSPSSSTSTTSSTLSTPSTTPNTIAPTLGPNQGLGAVLKSHLKASTQTTTTSVQTSDSVAINNSTEQSYNPFDIGSVFETTESSPETVSEPSPIPLPPPLPSEPLTKSSEPNSDLSFKQQLEHAVAERQLRSTEILDKLNQLTAFNLYDSERDKLKSDFFKYLKKPTTFEELKMETTSIDYAQISIGLLIIKDNNETIFPTGVQNHVTIIYTVVNGHKIVGGYLTSEKGKGYIKLSDFQPFPRNPDDKPLNAPQYFKPVKPFIVKDNDLELLPEETATLGMAYIHQKEIQDTLQAEFQSRILLELKNPINFYDSQGITLENINDVLSVIDQEKSSEAKKLFEKYENKLKKKGEENANIWLEKLQNDNKGAYPYVKKLVDAKNK